MMDNKPEVELLPCPWCGVYPSLTEIDHASYARISHTRECFLYRVKKDIEYGEQDKWNTRKPSPAPERVELDEAKLHELWHTFDKGESVGIRVCKFISAICAKFTAPVAARLKKETITHNDLRAEEIAAIFEAQADSFGYVKSADNGGLVALDRDKLNKAALEHCSEFYTDPDERNEKLGALLNFIDTVISKFGTAPFKGESSGKRIK